MPSEGWGLSPWVLAARTGQLPALQVLCTPHLPSPNADLSLTSLCLSFLWGPDPPICSQLQNPEPPCRVFLYQQPGKEVSALMSVAKIGIGGL